MNDREKQFDSVVMMRSVRDRISQNIEGMTLREELEWLASQEIQDPFLRRLRERAAGRSTSSPEQAVVDSK